MIEVELKRIADSLEVLAAAARGNPVVVPAQSAAQPEVPAKATRAAKALADALTKPAVPVVEADPFGDEAAPAKVPTRAEVMDALKAAAERVGQKEAQALLEKITGSGKLMPSVIDDKPNPKLPEYLAKHGAAVIEAANAAKK